MVCGTAPLQLWCLDSERFTRSASFIRRATTVELRVGPARANRNQHQPHRPAFHSHALARVCGDIGMEAADVG
jgi:hypothetical protein